MKIINPKYTKTVIADNTPQKNTDNGILLIL